MRTGLTKTTRSWFYFVLSNLILMKHISTMQEDKAMLTYVIMSGMKLIENSILESVYEKAITHPSLINELCLRAGVEIFKEEEKLMCLKDLEFQM